LNYEQSAINQEFETNAMLADDRVLEIERAVPTPHSSDRHDEALGDCSVYRFLQARPFLVSRQTLLEELRWVLRAEPKVPANAYSAERFKSSRISLIRKLIKRFEFPMASGGLPGLDLLTP
jgi:hypothetical protein